jgi:hypothetical protein
MSLDIVNLTEPINFEYDFNKFPYTDPLCTNSQAYVVFINRLSPSNITNKVGDFHIIIALLRTLSVEQNEPLFEANMLKRTNHLFSSEQWPIFLQSHRDISRLMRCVSFNYQDSIAWLSELLFHPTFHILIDVAYNRR